MNNSIVPHLAQLDQFRASDLWATPAGAGPAGPIPAFQVDISLIDFDPKQPRRNFPEASLQELSDSIREHGVLEPISIRTNPDASGRYIVSRGERRVRAAARCGLTRVPVIVDERVDPFAQAVENLHREDMSPLDLAAFIAEREQEGCSRADIARRLSKPKSFITEVASLSQAPSTLLDAVKAGHVKENSRVLYQLVSLGRENPEALQRVLAQPDAVSRGNVEQLMAMARRSANTDVASPSAVAVRAPSGGRTVLIVEHDGRRGALRWKASDDGLGEVRFGDGSRSKVPLSSLKAVCWATEDGR